MAMFENKYTINSESNTMFLIINTLWNNLSFWRFCRACNSAALFVFQKIPIIRNAAFCPGPHKIWVCFVRSWEGGDYVYKWGASSFATWRHCVKSHSFEGVKLFCTHLRYNTVRFTICGSTTILNVLVFI